jgi:hypothetical protein
MTRLFTSALLALAIVGVGCVGIREQQVRGVPYARPGATPSRETERRIGIVKGDVSADDDTVQIKATVPTECRDVRSTPMVVDQRTERALDSTSKQVWLGIGGASLVSLGIWATASSCPKVTGAAKDGNAYQNECLDGDKDREKALGADRS